MSDDEPKKDPKIAEPPKFDGEKENFRSWWLKMRVYIQLKPKTYTNDESKVFCVLSYMEGGLADDWSELRRSQYLDENKCPTWKAFQTEIVEAFTEEMVKEKAITAMLTTKQGTKIIDKHNADWALFSAKAELTDEIIKIQYYKNSIAAPIRRRIEEIDRDRRPATEKAWMKKASELDNDWRAYQAESRGFTNNKKAERTTTDPQKPSSTPCFTTTTNMPPARNNKMTVEERQKCITQGLCFRCKQQGHMASDTKFHPDARPPQKDYKRGGTANVRAAVEGGRGTNDDDDVSEEGRWEADKDDGDMGGGTADGTAAGTAARRITASVRVTRMGSERLEPRGLQVPGRNTGTAPKTVNTANPRTCTTTPNTSPKSMDNTGRSNADTNNDTITTPTEPRPQSKPVRNPLAGRRRQTAKTVNRPPQLKGQRGGNIRQMQSMGGQEGGHGHGGPDTTRKGVHDGQRRQDVDNVRHECEQSDGGGGESDF